MTFGSKHPEYVEHEQDWERCRDCYKGERAIKEKGTKYLPVLAGMVMDGYPSSNAKGTIDYCGYKDRAKVHNYLKKSVLHHMGLLHHKEATIELPPNMEPLRENATRHNESLLQLLRIMHEEMMVTGRLGLYGVIPKGSTTEAVMPYISLYTAENILNWDEGELNQVDEDSLNMVVLNESGPRRKDTFSWDLNINQYRVLLLGDPFINEPESGPKRVSADQQAVKVGRQAKAAKNSTIVNANAVNVKGAYFQDGLFEGESEWDPALMDIPTIRGVALGKIPFVIINSKDTQPKPDDPPQLDLANEDVSIYKSEADLRQALHMQAQPTLVLIGAEPEKQPGEEEPVRTGAGAVIRIPNPAGDAKYAGVPGEGIAEMRTTLENDMRRAELMSGSMTDSRSNEKESGDAMGKRMAGESCKLINIATTAARGLQTMLRMLAEWMGEDPEAVIVTANTEFDFKPLTPKDLLDLQAFATAGGPISDESIHINVQRSGLTDMEYEDEQEKIDSQEPRLALSGLPVDAPLDPLQQQTADHADERLELEKKAAAREAKAPIGGKKK